MADDRKSPDKKTGKKSGNTEESGRRARLAQALKANLQRRKRQARARSGK